MQKDEKKTTIPSELLHFVVAGKEIRVTIAQDQQIWLVASDVSEVLGYQDASPVLDSLDSKNIRANEQLYDENGNAIAVTFVNVMGCGTLAREAEPSAQAVFQNWVYQVLAVGTLHDLRNKANRITKPSPKKEIGFQNFVFNETDKIRVFLDENGEPWFVASDVCHCLKLNTSEALHGRKDRNYEDGIDEKCIDNVDIPHPQSPNKRLKALAVSESGFYQLVFKSKKKEAITFKNWVTKEVLPTIRKTGEYKMPTQSKTTDLSAEISPILMDFIIQKITEITLIEQQGHKETAEAMRKDIEDIKMVLQKFFSPVPTKPSYVYLAYNHNTGYYKPGKGDNPDGRAFALELGGSEIEVVSRIWFPSSAIAFAWEKAFHKMFEQEARGREWFELTEKQVQFFKNMAEVVANLYA